MSGKISNPRISASKHVYFFSLTSDFRHVLCGPGVVRNCEKNICCPTSGTNEWSVQGGKGGRMLCSASVVSTEAFISSAVSVGS